MTAHIAQSSSRCGASQVAVIIHADDPSIVPYMSCAISAIQIQQAAGMTTSRVVVTSRSCFKAASISVRLSGGTVSMNVILTVASRRTAASLIAELGAVLRHALAG